MGLVTRSEVVPGSSVGAYTVQSKLGETPWAETFAAFRGESLVALKIVDEGALAGWADVEQAKVRLAGVHPDLALPILEASSSYIVTPLSDHPSLADLVDIGALLPAEAIPLVKNLAIALDEAHAVALLHLALKPSNVFVGPPPSYAVRLADFGSDALRRAKNERGALMWLAPEQIDTGDAADAKADIFSLALLAFFALTAKPYWEAAADDADALLAEIRGDRKKPSERARALGVDLPAALDAPLLAALGPPEGRPSSARELAAALEATLAEKPVSPERAARQKKTQKLERYQPPPLQKQTVKMAPYQPPTPAPPPVDTVPPAARVDRRRWVVFAGMLLGVVVIGLLIRAAVTSPTAPPAPLPSASDTPAPAPPPPPPPPSSEPVVVPPPPSASEAPVIPPNQAEIAVVCEPACDRVFINNKVVPSYPAPVRMAPATYGIGVQKSGYAPQYTNVKCKGGERTTVTFVLRKK